MKKLFISAMLLGWALAGSAALPGVAGIERVDVPSGVSVDRAVISPDGSYVVLSANDDAALRSLTLADGRLEKIADNGNIFGLQFSDDSRQVVYRQNTVNKRHRRFTGVQAFDLDSRKTTQVLKPTRRFGGMATEGNTVVSVDNQRMNAKALSGKKTVSQPVATIHFGQLMVTRDGVTTAINPQGKQGKSYLWPSVSPDGTKVLYYLSGVGAFVCDLDGSNPVALGEVRAPRWLDDATVVGMRDYDNGYVFTKSTIVAADLQGNCSELTDDSFIAIYPSATADGSKVAFTTPAGELYIINLTR